MNKKRPICTIIAGVNGSGKTTFASKMLFQNPSHFINVDNIAEGLSPLSPDVKSLMAGRLLLQEIEKLVIKRESFAFETTLSGKRYQFLIKRLVKESWLVHLYYLWIPNIKVSIDRVNQRVQSGGHSIPKEIIERRYSRSINNFRNYYPLCNLVICLDNSNSHSAIIFTALNGSIVDIENNKICKKILGENYEKKISKTKSRRS